MLQPLTDPQESVYSHCSAINLFCNNFCIKNVNLYNFKQLFSTKKKKKKKKGGGGGGKGPQVHDSIDCYALHSLVSCILINNTCSEIRLKFNSRKRKKCWRNTKPRLLYQYILHYFTKVFLSTFSVLFLFSNIIQILIFAHKKLDMLSQLE